MENYKNLKKSTKIGLIVSAVLMLVVLVAGVIGAVQAFIAGRTTTAIFTVTDVIMGVLVLFYAFVGYKKPHGNLLRYVFFAFAIYLALQATLDIASKSFYIVGDAGVLAALLLSYIAGRLNKIKKNIFILLFVGLLILARVIVNCVTFPGSFGFFNVFGCMTSIIIYAALGFAYTARFEAHKAAGLADKADVEEK